MDSCLSSFKSIIIWFTGVSFFIVFFPVFFFFLMFFPREITYKIGVFYFKILIKIMGIDLKINGIEKIDLKKTYIIMANHQSLFDLFILPCSIPKPFVGIEASYHFKIPFWGWIIKKWGNIPINRHDKNKAIKSIKKAEKILNKGVSIVILPEGHRTITGKIGEFKKGGFYLAKNTKKDILPLGISKSLYYFKNKNSWKIKSQKVVVNIGKPVTYTLYKDLSIDQLANKVKEKILTLSQQN